MSHRKSLSHHMPTNHFHSTFEIYYLMSGKREFFIKDRTFVINEGDIVIISPNILHRTTNTELPKHERLIVNIHESCISTVINSSTDILQPLLEKEYAIITSSLQERLSIDTISHQILEEMNDEKSGFEVYAQTLVIQLLLICNRHLKQNSSEVIESQSQMHQRVSEIVQYLNTYYMHELSLSVVADKFYISPYYLSRFFKEATGFTFVEYLNSVRIKEAKKLLESSSMKVQLISRKVGFGSVTHFGRVFKSVTGKVPLYYRKKTKRL